MSSNWRPRGLRPFLRRSADRDSQRGATLSEYALIVSLIITVTIGVIAVVESESGSYLVESGSAIGEPRGLAADYGLANPVTPSWLTQPPPPTTSTSTTTTTTTAPGVGSLIQPGHSGLCLAVAGGSTADGAAVTQETCDGSLSQRWLFTDLGTGYWQIQAEHSNKCVDIDGGAGINGAALIQWPCHGGANQQMTITAHPAGGDRVTMRHSGRCLAIAGASTSPGAAAVQWDCHAGTEQAFDIT